MYVCVFFSRKFVFIFLEFCLIFLTEMSKYKIWCLLFLPGFARRVLLVTAFSVCLTSIAESVQNVL